MLSIASVKSASGAAQYFAKDDYYTAEHSSEATAWGGVGAARSVAMRLSLPTLASFTEPPQGTLHAAQAPGPRARRRGNVFV